MLIDKNLIFSDAQAITATANSTNEIDCGEANANLGAGWPLIINFVIEESFATLTSLTISLRHGASTGPTTSLVSLAAITATKLTKGAYVPEIMIPSQHLRYLALLYTVSGNDATAGKITAFIGIPK